MLGLCEEFLEDTYLNVFTSVVSHNLFFIFQKHDIFKYVYETHISSPVRCIVKRPT